MHDIAVFARFLYFYGSFAHHAVKFSTFIPDHELLGEYYEVYLDIYDSIIERMIGLKMGVNEFLITSQATNMFNRIKDVVFPKNGTYFVYLSQYEEKLRNLCAAANEGASLGVQNLVQQFCDDSEARSYKINQRIAAEI